MLQIRRESAVFRYDLTIPQSRMADVQARPGGQHKQQMGDPVRFARVLMDLAKCERQPKHLVVGSDALRRWYDKILRDSDEITRWKTLSEST